MVTIHDSQDVVVAVWNNVNIKQGLGYIEFQLPDDIVEGKWMIQTNTQREIIEIKKYVLPRFKIQFTHPKEIYKKVKTVDFKVCAL